MFSLIYSFCMFCILGVFLTAIEQQSDVFMRLPTINTEYLHFSVLLVNQEPVVICIELGLFCVSCDT